MKQLFTVTLLILSLTITAQNTATTKSIESKDIYILLKNTTPSNYIKAVKLTKEQISSIANIEDRVIALLKNVQNIDFDAIVTRDGNTARLYKYKAAKSKAIIPNYFGKEVYFLSKPTKKYKTIITQEIVSADLQKPFHVIAKKYSENEKVSFDAVIISGSKADYIQYK